MVSHRFFHTQEWIFIRVDITAIRKKNRNIFPGWYKIIFLLNVYVQYINFIYANNFSFIYVHLFPLFYLRLGVFPRKISSCLAPSPSGAGTGQRGSLDECGVGASLGHRGVGDAPRSCEGARMAPPPSDVCWFITPVSLWFLLVIYL